MAQLPQTAMTEGNDETSDFTPIPVGNYEVIVVKSELRDTRAGDGKYLNLQMKVMEGDHRGRVLFDMLNIINPNPVAVEIANKKLNAICKAAGLRDVEDSEEFHDIPIMAKVAIDPGDEQWPAKNVVKGYSSIDDASSGSGEGKTLPWE